MPDALIELLQREQKHIQELEAINAELVKALEAAKFRLFGAGPSTDPLYAQIRDAIAKGTAR